MNVLRILVALSAVALAAAVHGAPVVKYRMPDGRIVYSDEVPPTGKPLGVMPEPPPRQAIEPDRVARMKREREATDKAVAIRLAKLNAADAEVTAAARALTAAQAALAAGTEPQAGERLATVQPGRTRLANSYWDRQRALQRAVDAARRRLDRAHLARNALK